MSDYAVELSVVLPAFGEEENLRYLLPKILQTLETLGVTTEVLVIDTHVPMDKTNEVCAQYHVRHIKRRGGDYFGCAVRTGIDEAKGRFLLFMDADGSHPPEFIPQLFCYAEQSDVVIASRYIEKGGTENNFILILMSRLVNWSFSWALNLPCHDVSNSFKMYRAEQIKSITLSCNNFDIVEEILVCLRAKNPLIRFKEIPFVFKKRMFGETKRNLFVFILSYVFTIVRLKLLR